MGFELFSYICDEVQNTQMTALEKYNENPNFCKQCSAKIEVKENERASEAKRRVFCSRSCSATYNNSGVRRHGESHFCGCGNKKVKSASQCKKCSNKLKAKISEEKTLYELSNKKSNYIASRHNELRKRARSVLEVNSVEKKCKFCTTDEFKEVLEVAHIVSVSSFSLDTKVKEVNAIYNLMYVCPSHHRMFDKGLISL